MRIVIDARCLVEGRRTGVEEYTLGLLSELFEFDKKNEYILFVNSWKEPKFNFSYFKKFPNVRVKRFRFPNKLLNFLFWYLGWPKIDRMAGGSSVDILFLPNIIFFAASKDVKVVSTIHDLSFERYSEHFSLKRKLWHLFINARKICRRADKIIAVSISTKNDLVNLYGIQPQKIEVVKSAVSKELKSLDRNNPALIGVKEKYKLPYRFILFLGTIEPRKNITGLVRAYNVLQMELKKQEKTSLVAQDMLRYELVIAGEKGWKSEGIFREIEKSPYREKIKVVSKVCDQDKTSLYNLASLFTYPSFFEGFGFPPLEAMACGAPVIASNNSSIPEVVGEAGVLIDPDKPDEIYRAMREILGSRAFRDTLRERGFARAGEFSWRKTAVATFKIFEKLSK